MTLVNVSPPWSFVPVVILPDSLDLELYRKAVKPYNFTYTCLAFSKASNLWALASDVRSLDRFLTVP